MILYTYYKIFVSYIYIMNVILAEINVEVIP